MQPPTPKQTPTSGSFPSPVFETPRAYQGSFTEGGAATPRFAEEYSVFNATPGNLRGTQGEFSELVPATPGGTSLGHKRLLSAEGFAIDIAARGNTFSPNPSASLPPVGPSQRVPSSPNSARLQRGAGAAFQAPLSPKVSRSPVSTKKVRRDSTKTAEPTQVISPPPTVRKGERKLAPKLTMQDDQSFGQPDFGDSMQQPDMASLMANTGDMFGYPLSAPATAPPNFWDANMPLPMDFDFSSAANPFQSPNMSLHRHTGSFDWNSDIQMFQETTMPAAEANEVLAPATRHERPLAPKPAGASEPGTQVSTYGPTLDDPFGIIGSGDAVDPGLLLSRPQSAAMDTDFGTIAQPGAIEAVVGTSDKTQPGSRRRASGTKTNKAGKAPDRSFNASPVKALGRPALARSASDSRGKKTAAGRRGSLPILAPAAKPGSGSGLVTSKSSGRLPGRTSPLKAQQLLSGLAPIPESSPNSGPRTSVRLTIDANGRAKAETLTYGQASWSSQGLTRSQSSHDLPSQRNWEAAQDSDDSDDEPIIIPSRNHSFSASFALPDPRKPVGSIFHSSRRSISDRSASNSANDGESEAETVMNEQPSSVGDAASELRKVVQDRHKRTDRLPNIDPQRYLNTSVRNFTGGIISPTSLADSSYDPDSCGVRCVCDKSKADERDGFMVQW